MQVALRARVRDGPQCGKIEGLYEPGVEVSQTPASSSSDACGEKLGWRRVSTSAQGKALPVVTVAAEDQRCNSALEQLAKIKAMGASEPV